VLGLGNGGNNAPPAASQVAANSGTLISGSGGATDSRYRLKTSTPVDGESGGDNRPPYYALAFIMRVD
jgi:hypothetical protein